MLHFLNCAATCPNAKKVHKASDLLTISRDFADFKPVVDGEMLPKPPLQLAPSSPGAPWPAARVPQWLRRSTSHSHPHQVTCSAARGWRLSREGVDFGLRHGQHHGSPNGRGEARRTRTRTW